MQRMLLVLLAMVSAACGGSSMMQDGGAGNLIGSYTVTIGGMLTNCGGHTTPLSGSGTVAITAAMAGASAIVVTDPAMARTGTACALDATATGDGAAVIATGQNCMDVATGTPFMLINGSVSLQNGVLTLITHWQSTTTSSTGCETLDESSHSGM